MATYTSLKEFSFGDIKGERHIIVTGTVTIAALNGAIWQDTDVFSNGGFFIRTSNVRIRVTPEPGTTYTIDELSSA